MANHAIVRLDLMAGTTNPALLRSVRYHDGSDYAAIDNGNVVALDSLITGEREVFKAVKPTAKTKLEAIALIASPEYMVDERKHNLDEFTNEKGDIARAYIFHNGDIFSVTAEALDGTPSVGHAVEVKAGQTKIHTAATETASALVIGKVIEIDTVGSVKYYVIAVAPHVGVGG